MSDYRNLSYVGRERWESLYDAVTTVLSALQEADERGDVLVVGKGPGLLEAVLQVFGISSVSADIDHATQPNFVGSVEKLSQLVNGAVYPVVTCLQVLEHLPGSATTLALSELWKCTGSPGTLLLSVPQYGPILYGELKVPRLGHYRAGAAIPTRNASFRTDEHEWELGHKSMPRRAFERSLRELDPRAITSWQVPRNPYHRFYKLSR